MASGTALGSWKRSAGQLKGPIAQTFRYDQNGTRRTLTWNEENRREEIQDDGHTDRYVHNPGGRRTLKRGLQGITVSVNPWHTARPGSIGGPHASRRVDFRSRALHYL